MASSNDEIEVGDVAILLFTLTLTEGGGAADPTSTTVAVTEPDGSVTLYTSGGGQVTAPTTSTRRCEHPVTQVGKHTATCTGTDPASTGTLRFVVTG